MGTKLKNIVNVVIQLATAILSRFGFGTPLFLTPFSNLPNRIYTYSSPESLIADGFTTSSPAYKAALRYFGQSQSVKQFKLAKKNEDVNAQQRVTFNALATAGSFTVTVGAETTAAIAYNATAVAIETAIELLTGVASVTVDDDMPTLSFVVEFTGADGNKHWDTISVGIGSLTGVASVSVTNIAYGSAIETWDEALVAVLAADSDWFMLNASTRTKADILLMAPIIQATDNKMYAYCSKDADVKTSATTDVFTAIKNLAYDKVFGIWSNDEANYPECAWCGLEMSRDPGSSDWYLDTLTGITPDTLTDSEIGYMKGKYANYYETIAGRNVTTSECKTGKGEYIDVMYFIAWLAQTIREDVFVQIADADKIPYTDVGIGAIQNTVLSVLRRGAKAPYNGIINDSIVVTVPARADVPTADLANRQLNNVNFSALLQGAIFYTDINGTLSL